MSTWLITGSSRGLGRALAEAVLSDGQQLVATARDPAQLDDLRGRFGDRVLPFPLDVTDATAASRAVAAAVETFGRLDVVVNNAGYANLGSIEDTPLDDFRAQIETNFFGVVNVTRAAIPVLRAQGSGHVIQVSSIGGRIGTPGLAAYQGAKWGMEGFSEVLAREVAPLGVKVTILEPGGFRTEWAGSSMAILPTTPPYEPTVGTLAAMFNAGRERGSAAPGDPAKAAAVILEIARMDEPPLRVVLGAAALAMAEATNAQRAAEDARWRHLSLATEYDS